MTGMPHRECDLVMKGGITSGVVYAGAIAELAREFRFRSLGGTSAGAIGAAVAAAAGCRPWPPPAPRSADRLRPLIEDLTTQGHFPGLLQPFPAGRPVLAVMLALLRQDRGPVLRGLAALWRVVWARWWVPLLTTAGAAWAVWALVGQAELSTLAAAALIVLVVLVALGATVAFPAALLALAVWRRLGRAENRYGLCSGISTGSEPALTDWLHTTIQQIAGLPESEPLTFAHLDEAQIELAMISTDLAAARPVRLPPDRWSQTGWWYDPDELAGLFPASVCDYLNGLPGEADPQGLAAAARPRAAGHRRAAHESQRAAAARLRPAATRGPGARGRRVRGRSWFSDGGVTSNFPIHFFDAVAAAAPDVRHRSCPGRLA